MTNLSKKLASKFLQSKQKVREPDSANQAVIILSKRKSRSSSSKKVLEKIVKHTAKADLSKTFEEIKNAKSDDEEEEKIPDEDDSDNDDVFGFMKSKLEKKQKQQD